MGFIIARWTFFLLTIILVIFVGSLLIWYFIEGESWSRSISSINSGNVEIILPSENVILVTDGKFSPSLLTIRAGQKVTWVNKSESPIRVVADYPRSRYMPNLITNDVEKDESFSMSFVIPGDWRYHDYYNDLSRGRIIIQ